MEDKPILAAWERHAEDWLKLIASEGIASRQVTNPAILDFVSEQAAGKVLLDIGCGEGWLSHALRAKGFTCFGLDGTKALVDEANKKSKQQHFFHLDYAQLEEKLLARGLETWEELLGPRNLPSTFLFNFSLYHRGTGSLLKAIHSFSPPDSRVLIQTLHPFAILQQEKPYAVHCLPDAWKGLPGKFQQGHAFEMLTFEAWTNLFAATSWQITALREPVREGKPVSVLFSLKKV
ncbi:type 11 methyltransferase [Nitritalea halalkaliphila LW7]|uniref:Type 11 methyltransferase n=1 Tax=Nitritalea halalkaliphila LW7 TaxID=1189621 RepID=I5C375_9BACT|nr:methyltransferase domain-containing protein [Nitritalea halalkaliphila]EIM76277.1 type 11 methyltransferase [Nitritalea halalkaliphila LW7]